MSGPIVRRYGFPNFDKIFGKKELEHGVDDPESPAETPAPETSAETRKPEPMPKPETKPGA
jgi:hypothetical protein